MDKQLYDAAERGDIVEAVNRLLDEGADTEYRDLVSEVVIIYLFIFCLLNGQLYVLIMMLCGFVNVVKLEIDL